MPEKYFLALDFNASEIIEKGLNAIKIIENEFGSDFVKNKISVKLNDYSFRNNYSDYTVFRELGCEIFADLKIFHGAGTGYKTVQEIEKQLKIDYFTVATHLGKKILSEYVKKAEEDKLKVIGFTAHTKISEQEIMQVHNNSLENTVYLLGKIAVESNCHAMVLDAASLQNPKIQSLPIKKLVPGLRLEKGEEGEQARASLLQKTDFSKIDFALISSRYLENKQKLTEFIQRTALTRSQNRTN